MRVARSLDSSMSSVNEYRIATATAITEGQILKLTAGLVVACAAGETAAILGTAAEAHTGSADTLNTRSNGVVIKVNDSPANVFEAPAPRATATSGSTTTMAATGLAAFTDDDFVGGYIKLVSKATSSTNTDAIGTVYPITGSTAATKLFTFTKTAGGAVTAGDVFEIYAPTGFAKGNFDSAIQKVVLTTNAAIPVKVYGNDTNRGVTQYIATLHLNANKAS